MNLDKGPQFSLSGKGLPKKFNENPGEFYLVNCWSFLF